MKFATVAGMAALMSSAAVSTATAAPGGSNGYIDLVEEVSPAVVFVKVTEKVQGVDTDTGPMTDPRFEEFMKRFGGKMMPQQRRVPRQGVGSGFIISEDGLIVTNHHVIDGAGTVTVTLESGEEVGATIVGSDPLTDIALLDIEGDDYPMVSFGSSEELKVGEEVIAVGSPFGLGGTVTSGIISAKSRNINSGPFDDFLQTDAAINRGNSGGPLFNMDGEVVGVNTAIYSPDGGSVGIGFSVPADLVTEIVADLQDDGEIERSWLGVQIKPVSEDVAHVLGMTAGEGVMVEEIVDDSPAESAGLEVGDIIMSFGDTEITELRDLTRSVAMKPSGEKTTMEVFRGGETVSLDVTLEKRKQEDA
jgi:serine protease Do